VNESAGDERLVTDEEIVAVVVVVAMVGMVVAGMCSVWFPGVMMIDGLGQILASFARANS
jgi:hypothetical protein